MYKVGLSTTGQKICEETIKMYGSAKLEYIEISCGKDEIDSLDYEKLKEWCDKYNVKIWSFHLPFYPFDVLDISNEALADYTVKYLSDIILKASRIGVDKFIIHASGEPIEESQRQKRMETAKKSLYALAEVAKGACATICVEDLPRTCLGRSASDILELLSVHPSLRACFDTNHLLSEDNIDFVKKIGDKIVTLHVSDYDFINERHWLPGEGKNDWQGILNTLKEIGYSGIWLYEIDMQCPKTIIRPRALTVKDFQLNAKEVFENSKITIISTPKENLGYWD